MNQTEKYIKNAIAQGGGLPGVASNTPTQYADRQKQYFADRNRAYTEERACLASDFVKAKVQGIGEDFETFVDMSIRLSDILTPSTSQNKRVDDFKEVLIPNRAVTYIPLGAKIQTMGSTWLVINPSNLSSVNTQTVVARCNASYNSYDSYGNIVTEPLLVEKVNMLGNDNEKSENIIIMDGYFNITCQLNANTARLSENSRILLGRKAYYITGFTDFIQEFTGDRASNHLITFTARVTEPTENDDTTINYIANAKSTVFSASMNGQDSMKAGTTAQFTPQFLLNGEIVSPSEAYPQTWLFESDNEAVATVDEFGVVEAISDGTAQITATLQQNPSIQAETIVSVEEGITEPYVEFLGFVEKSILQYTSATYDAAYFEDGIETDEPLAWTLDGAARHDYTVTFSPNAKSITVECVSASDTPLIITASARGRSASISVELSGY